MEDNIKELIGQFNKIKNDGWIISQSKGTGGIGLTFENLIGKQKDSFEIPDFKGIEIKTKRNYSSSYTTLFNAAPESEYIFETNRLRDLYGYNANDGSNFKILNNEVFANKRNWISSKFQFLLKVSYTDKKIYLLIFNSSGDLIEKETYWGFDTLEEKIYRKLRCLAFITADSKFCGGHEYFKYKTIEIYKFKNFETFLKLIENGKITICFKIGVFKSGERVGQTHDHGTGFNIKKEHFELLYNKYYL